MTVPSGVPGRIAGVVVAIGPQPDQVGAQQVLHRPVDAVVLDHGAQRRTHLGAGRNRVSLVTAVGLAGPVLGHDVLECPVDDLHLLRGEQAAEHQVPRKYRRRISARSKASRTSPRETSFRPATALAAFCPAPVASARALSPRFQTCVECEVAAPSATLRHVGACRRCWSRGAGNRAVRR